MATFYQTVIPTNCSSDIPHSKKEWSNVSRNLETATVTIFIVLYKGEGSEVEFVSMKVVVMESSHIAPTCMMLVLTSEATHGLGIFW